MRVAAWGHVTLTGAIFLGGRWCCHHGWQPGESGFKCSTRAVQLQREPDALEFVQGLAATTGCSRTRDVIATPVLSGLHHRYARYDFREGQGKRPVFRGL